MMTEQQFRMSQMPVSLMESFLLDCYIEAAKSPDTSTQIGALLLSPDHTVWPGTLANNGFPPGWEAKPEDLERPRKYQLIGHAEQTAIHKAARLGWPLRDGTMVASWAACCDCAKAIAQSGISTLIRHAPPLDGATDRWLESVSMGDRILDLAGVQIINVYGPIYGAPSILRDGQRFYPGGENGNS